MTEDGILDRECPLCGEPIEGFRGTTLYKGVVPPEYQEKWNEDVKACENSHHRSELIDRSLIKRLIRVFKGKSFRHPNIGKAKRIYGCSSEMI